MPEKRPPFTWLRNGWLIAGISLLILLGLEGVARLYDSLRPAPASQAGQLNPFTSSGDSSWVPGYLQEFEESGSTSWHSYTYWRRNPFAGRYINVDPNGYRVTRNPAVNSSRTTRIFVFGGSSVWGPWVRDANTIPSLLAQALDEAGIKDVIVTNLGESGYVSTQEVLQLMLELRKGNIPDIVLFYDGVNDVFSSYQNGIAGIPLNEEHRRMEFNSAQQISFIGWLTSSSALVKNLLRLRDKMQNSGGLAQNLGISRSEALVTDSGLRDSLAESTLRMYQENMRMVRSLGHEYGFETYFFWQPTIFSKETLAADEREYASTFPHGLAEFFRLVYSRIRMRPRGLENLTDLQDAFNRIHEPVFIDYCHVREGWNPLLARAIGSVLTDQSNNLKRDAKLRK